MNTWEWPDAYARASEVGMSSAEMTLLAEMHQRLHDISTNAGIGMPSPVLDGTDWDVELAWLDVRQRKTLTFRVDGNDTVMFCGQADVADEVVNPTDEVIMEKMKWLLHSEQ